MATGETGFGGVTFDLFSVQHHSVISGRDDDPCARRDPRGIEWDCLRPRDEDAGAANWFPRELKMLSGRTGVGMVTYGQRSGALGVAPY